MEDKKRKKEDKKKKEATQKVGLITQVCLDIHQASRRSNCFGLDTWQLNNAAYLVYLKVWRSESGRKLKTYICFRKVDIQEGCNWFNENLSKQYWERQGSPQHLNSYWISLFIP